MESSVTVGIDTHKDVNVAIALGAQGNVLGTRAVPTSPAGHAELLAWARGFGPLDKIGIEGTGSYGVGLTRFLRSAGCVVLEVERPQRHRPGAAKTDALDAERAARAVLAGEARAFPKGSDGVVERLRVLWITRRSAVKARTQAANQLHGLVVTASDSLRDRLRRLSTGHLVAEALRWRVCQLDSVESAARFAIQSLARRHQQLDAEVSLLDQQVKRLVEQIAPELLAVRGVGYETATTLLVAAGDNPDRLRSEAAFAHLCGVAPIPASSGKTVRHRLNRAGDRQANRALFLIVLVRMYRDARTRMYVARRTAEGLSKPEIIRCLKRYVARELFQLLVKARS